jgi:hypothetical protein
MLEIVWAIALAAWAVLIAVGIETGKALNFRATYVCFAVAGLILIGTDVMWAISTEHPLVWRLFISGLIGAIGVITLSEGARYVAHVGGNGTDEAKAKIHSPDAPPMSSAGKNSPNVSAGGNVSIGHVGDVIQQAPASNAPKNYGVLGPKNETLINGDHVSRMIQVGDSGPHIRFDGKEGEPIFRLFKDSDLLVEIVNGRLKISTKLADRSGRVVAELIRNEWKVAPSPQVWDRNYSDDALEVKGPDGNIILQTRILPDKIQIAGVWYGPNSSFFAMSPGPDGTGFLRINPQGGDPNFAPPKIKPMFNYPSDLHFGELADK